MSQIKSKAAPAGRKVYRIIGIRKSFCRSQPIAQKSFKKIVQILVRIGCVYI